MSGPADTTLPETKRFCWVFLFSLPWSLHSLRFIPTGSYPMIRFLISLLLFSLAGRAQIEIEVVPEEEPEVEPVGQDLPEGQGHGQPEERQTETLFFLNGNELHGQLVEVEADELVWSHPDVSEPIHFDTGNVKEVELLVDQEATEELLILPQIELTNGDRYRGRIDRLEDGKLSVHSPAAGSITLQASMLHSIQPTSVSTMIYDGPQSEEEWEFHNHSGGSNTWFYQDQALYATDRNLAAVLSPQEVPDMYTLQLDLEWKGMLNFQLGYWGQNTDNPSSNSYVISLQNNYLRAYRNYNNLGRNNFVNQQIRDQLNEGNATLTLHLNKKEKEVIFLLDGQVVGQWKDTFDGSIRGDTVILYTQADSSMRVSRIQLKEWDGELRTGEDRDAHAQDRLTTTNGDEFVGEVVNIRDEVLTFKNEFATFKVPLGRTGELRFGSETRQTPRLMEGDVKIRTPGGEVITLKLDQLKEGRLKGSSESTGELSLLLRYFSEMTFNPYDERHEEHEFSW